VKSKNNKKFSFDFEKSSISRDENIKNIYPYSNKKYNKFSDSFYLYYEKRKEKG